MLDKLDKEIELMVRELPEPLKIKAIAYIEQLKKGQNKDLFKFSWEGGLSDISEQYTSVELQQKATEWR